VTAQVFIQKAAVNLLSTVLDTPEFLCAAGPPPLRAPGLCGGSAWAEAARPPSCPLNVAGVHREPRVCRAVRWVSLAAGRPARRVRFKQR